MPQHIARYRVGGVETFGLLQDDGDYRRLAGSPFDDLTPTDAIDKATEVTRLAPIRPRRIFGAGLNYVSHIAEMGMKRPEIPMLFMKPDSTIVGPGDPIVYPREGEEVHFEAELAVVIGRRARRIGEAEALDHVLGYTCANDVSERVIQGREMAMGCLVVGKSFDTFCPLGPVIATDLDPTALRLKARLNGEERQNILTSDLLFSAATLVSYLSQAITLEPGDVILTGTPSGVGPIRPGDVVDIEVEGVGILTNPVVAEA
ncbi:MAG: fumarylacetoacetate hydrolase family protein [Azospirillaceae bacterium]